jgi:hypothetical protein
VEVAELNNDTKVSKLDGFGLLNRTTDTIVKPPFVAMFNVLGPELNHLG